MKKDLCISMSGGETSAYLTYWLMQNKATDYENVKIIFANTGDENEQTLQFIDKCEKHFGWNIIWVEGVYNKTRGIGIRSKVVNFETASRKGEPFKEMVSKYGIPNIQAPYCSHYLKRDVIRYHLKETGWKGYYTAIGVRADEVDRISSKWQEDKLIYPLIHLGVTKPFVNKFWRDMPFRLELKGYEGNCKVCWKKSLRKHLTIAKENPEKYEAFADMEKKYEMFIPEGRKENENIKPPLRFFRGNLTTEKILEMSKEEFELALDDSKNYVEYKQLQLFGYDLDKSAGCLESCDAF